MRWTTIGPWQICFNDQEVMWLIQLIQIKTARKRTRTFTAKKAKGF